MRELMAEIHENESGLIMRSHMTLRDYFAGQALAGWMASFTPNCVVKNESCAKFAYELADAMMEARK